MNKAEMIASLFRGEEAIYTGPCTIRCEGETLIYSINSSKFLVNQHGEPMDMNTLVNEGWSNYYEAKFKVDAMVNIKSGNMYGIVLNSYVKNGAHYYECKTLNADIRHTIFHENELEEIKY